MKYYYNNTIRKQSKRKYIGTKVDKKPWNIAIKLISY